MVARNINISIQNCKTEDQSQASLFCWPKLVSDLVQASNGYNFGRDSKDASTSEFFFFSFFGADFSSFFSSSMPFLFYYYFQSESAATYNEENDWLLTQLPKINMFALFCLLVSFFHVANSFSLKENHSSNVTLFFCQLSTMIKLQQLK